MHSVIQIFLLLPIFILTTTTTNATFDSDTNDVIVREPTSSYSAPLPYPLTTPCDTVPEMNRKSYFELATTTLADTYKHAWYLRKRGKLSKGNSKEIQEKDGDTSNDDDKTNYPDHYPYDVCFYAHFSKDFSENSERDWILRRYWAIIDEYCDSISNQTITIVPSAPLAEWVSETPTTKLLTKRMVKVGYVILMIFIVASLVELQPRSAVAARRSAVVPRRPTFAARMPTVATRRGHVPAIVGSDVWVYITTQRTTTTPPNTPPRCVCGKFLWEGCPCLEMTLEALEAWRN